MEALIWQNPQGGKRPPGSLFLLEKHHLFAESECQDRPGTSRGDLIEGQQQKLYRLTRIPTLRSTTP